MKPVNLPLRVINPSTALLQHQAQLKACQLCPHMIRPVITCQPVLSPVILLGQAPGIHEAKVMQPFGWTAGKTLFQWFNSIGLAEAQFRERVYMAAVCRCFPGKNQKGSGDRVPSAEEISHCARWLDVELQLLQPHLLILVGKLAIQQFLSAKKLEEVVGRVHQRQLAEKTVDLLPLPHPSGLSTWPHTEPGKTLLRQALQTLQEHPVWQQLVHAELKAG